jgi:hypothetical protein
MNSLNNSAAHHIVAGGANYPNAVNARNLLKEANIDINEAANGVSLPNGSKYVIDEVFPHQNIHTKVYYEIVYSRLSESAPTKRREELQK